MPMHRCLALMVQMMLFHNFFDVVRSAVLVVSYSGQSMRLHLAVILTQLRSVFCGRSMGDLTFPTLLRLLKSWRCRCHKVMKVGRLCILSINTVGFASTMACSVAMVYFTMENWVVQCGIGNFLLQPILDATMSIKRISRLDGGVCTVLMSCFWRAAACGDNIRQSLCLSWCSEIITDDIEVIDFFSKSTTIGNKVVV